MYLSTVLDDYSRYIIAWKLCSTMRAEDVTDTLDLALAASGCDQAHVHHRPRLLSDNGPSYIAGELATLHSNSPRECLARMENMVMMGDIKIPKEAISRQIADSVDLIVQVKRLRDGSRRTTNITEVIGMEGEVIVTQELFKFEYLDESSDGKIIGEFRSMGLRPYSLEKAKQYGFDQPYLEACL